MRRMTIHINVIKLLAIWAVDVIDRYLKDVPLEALTHLYRSASTVSSSSASSAIMAPRQHWYRCAMPHLC